MDILTGGTSYSTALTAKKWETVTGTCTTTIASGATSPVPSIIVGTGPNYKTTVTVTEGIPSKPVKAAS